MNVHQERLIFSTEGHIFPISDRFRQRREDVFSVSSKRRLPKPLLHISEEKSILSDGWLFVCQWSTFFSRFCAVSNYIPLHSSPEKHHLRDWQISASFRPASRRELYGATIRVSRPQFRLVELNFLYLIFGFLAPFSSSEL